MDEQKAHELYTSLQGVDAGARFKQGIGFAGRGISAGFPGGYSENQEDDDVVARNRRIRAALYGGTLLEQEPQDNGYDSDTAEAVQRRLAQLKKEQRRERPREADRLPDRLYDEQRERQQMKQQQEGRRSRNRSRSKERHRRSCSSSRERRGEHRHRHIRSKSRSRSRERQWYDKGRRQCSQTRSCSREQRWRRSWSQGEWEQGGQREGGRGDPGPAALQQYNFEALIPGYSAMSAPQRMQAKTQYLLERSAAHDQRRERARKGKDGGAGACGKAQWTRYRFDAAAELEEPRAQPPPAAGLGVGLGQRGGGEDDGEDEASAHMLPSINSVTFQQSNAVVVQKERDDSHAAAIFGGGDRGGAAAGRACGAAAGRGGVPAAASAGAAPAAGALGEAGRAAGELPYLLALAEAEGVVVVSPEEAAGAGALAQQQEAAAGGPGPKGGSTVSWRERALAAKHAKQQLG